MGQKVKIALLVMCILMIGVAGYAGWVLRSQGNAHDYWKRGAGDGVSFDEFGVPTIRAAGWTELVRLQGHVVASERLWQMDLIRRKAAGRLSEWFGKPAFEHDEGNQKEDRINIAKTAADLLPVDERKTCDEYARGVNDFITASPGRWGIEYKLLGVEPEPWQCADSMLVLIEMAELLTQAAPDEARSEVWRRNLSKGWDDFLFTLNHPWNKPLFGESDVAHAPFPPEHEYLPAAPLDPEKHASVNFTDPDIVGSNNWAWSGSSGKFLANDPHLGQSVPQIWYALRLLSDKDHWLAGVALPGLPGVVIGRNAHVAWSFTNTGEDVDDFLEEKLSADGQSYLAKVDKNGEVWAPVIHKTFEIKVKDEANPRVIEGLFTHRGPLSTRKYLGTKKLYARQWLVLRPEVLRLPVEMLFRAKTLDEHSDAIANMRLPAQNVVSMDREGNIRYRTSGTGVERTQSGRRPIDAISGEWRGLQPAAKRPELTIPFSAENPGMLATANERIWIDQYGHNWFSDDRKDRIMSVLAESPAHTVETMQKLHLDTTGRFRKLLIAWVVARVDQQQAVRDRIPARWRNWDGSSATDPLTFAESELIEKEMTRVFISRVAETFSSEVDKKEDYFWFMRRAWLLTVLLEPEDKGTRIFGVDDKELAAYLVTYLAEQDVVPHHISNKWTAQHPFVANVPLIGKIFAVSEIEQYGAGDLVAAEKPTFGPSMRMVWDLGKPENSTWVFPVGQSGHVWSTHYRGFRSLWMKHGVTRVFPEDEMALFGL